MSWINIGLGVLAVSLWGGAFGYYFRRELYWTWSELRDRMAARLGR